MILSWIKSLFKKIASKFFSNNHNEEPEVVVLEPNKQEFAVSEACSLPFTVEETDNQSGVVETPDTLVSVSDVILPETATDETLPDAQEANIFSQETNTDYVPVIVDIKDTSVPKSVAEVKAIAEHEIESKTTEKVANAISVQQEPESVNIKQSEEVVIVESQETIKFIQEAENDHAPAIEDIKDTSVPESVAEDKAIVEHEIESKTSEKVENAIPFKQEPEPVSENIKKPEERVDEVLERFKSISRGLSLLAHSHQEIQLVQFAAGQIIASFNKSGKKDFIGYFSDIYLRNKDNDPTSPYNILNIVITGLSSGDNDSKIIQSIKALLQEQGRKEIKQNPSNNPSRTSSSCPQAKKTNDGNKLQSLTRKHRALQYSNEIAAELLEGFEQQSGEDDFLSYVESKLKPLKTKNPGYLIQFGKQDKTDKTSSHSSTGGTGIRVSTDVLSPAHALTHPDTFTNDFLYVANAISTMRVKHISASTHEPNKHSEKATSKTSDKSTSSLYNDTVHGEFTSLLKSDKRFDVVFRMLSYAASRLRKGCTKEQVIEELRRFEVKDLPAPARTTTVTPPPKATVSVAQPFSSKELYLIQAARTVASIIGNHSIETRLIQILHRHSYQAGGEISFYKDVLLNRISETSEHLVLLEIIILMERGESIYGIFTKIFSKPENITRYIEGIKPTSEPTSTKKDSIYDNVIYRGWNATAGILTKVYESGDNQSIAMKINRVTPSLINMETLHRSFPWRFNTKDAFCRPIVISDEEVPIFKGYEIRRPNVSSIVYVPISRYTLNEVFSLISKAVKK